MDGHWEDPIPADPARLAAASREVEAFAREKGATVTQQGSGRWRVERKPRLFKIGFEYWIAELQANGGLVFSEREWRPDPKYD